MYTANLICHLAQVHQVDLVSLVFPEDQQHLQWSQDRCASVHTIPVQRASIARRLANFGSSYIWGRQLHYRRTIHYFLDWGRYQRKWDVLHVEGGFMAGLVPFGYPLPKILSLHDSEILRTEELLNCPLGPGDTLRYMIRRYYEPRYARLVYSRFDCCVLVAERDAECNRQVVSQSRFVVISSGIDTEHYLPAVAEPTPAAIVFHGNLSYPPNVDAARHLAKDILPLVQRQIPKATLKLVGAAPNACVKALASCAGVSLSADLPDLRPALASGQIYASAVRYGSGLKTKLLEAMAMELPIVCYRSSISGIDCVPGKHLLVADDPQEFGRCIVDLLEHPEDGSRMAKNARQLVIEKYRWESKADQWSALYREVVGVAKSLSGIPSGFDLSLGDSAL